LRALKSAVHETRKKKFFGRARVVIGGREVSHLEKGSFVGEVAFLADKPATATVIAEGDLRAITFDRSELRQFFDKETEVAGLITSFSAANSPTRSKSAICCWRAPILERAFVCLEPVTSEPSEIFESPPPA
jgi:hypothetical protein